MIDLTLKLFTALQDKLFLLVEKGIDVQKLQTFFLIILSAVHFVYSIVFLLTFQFHELATSGAVFVVTFYYAMSLNQVLNEDE